MKFEERMNDPPPPVPLPIPRYDQFFTEQERQSMDKDLLLDLADEIILIRSHMQHLFQAALQNPSPPASIASWVSIAALPFVWGVSCSTGNLFTSSAYPIWKPS